VPVVMSVYKFIAPTVKLCTNFKENSANLDLKVKKVKIFLLQATDARRVAKG
jgi:hypothetical protein